MKLSGWVIFGTWLLLGFGVAAYAFFQVYQPNKEAAANNVAYKVLLDAEVAKQKRAEDRVAEAMKRVKDAATDWNSIVGRYTPPDSLVSGGVDINENAYQLVVDTTKYRNSAQRAFNAQLHVGHVKVVAAPEIPQPTDSEKDILASFYNYPAFTFPVVLWELGSVTVTGTYAQISANVRAWSSMPHYLAVVDGLRIDGTSPNLTGTYNVTLVGFIHAKAVYPPPPGVGAPDASAPGSGASPGAGAGGPPKASAGPGMAVKPGG